VVFTMVGAPADVEEVILGPSGVLAGLRPGGLLVDMTTSTPSLAKTIAAWAAVQVQIRIKQDCASPTPRAFVSQI